VWLSITIWRTLKGADAAPMEPVVDRVASLARLPARLTDLTVCVAALVQRAAFAHGLDARQQSGAL
jgi:hypothetical protein